MNVFACAFLGDGDTDDCPKFEVVAKTEIAEIAPHKFACLVGYKETSLADKTIESLFYKGKKKRFVKHVLWEILNGVWAAGNLNALTRNGETTLTACGVVGGEEFIYSSLVLFYVVHFNRTA